VSEILEGDVVLRVVKRVIVFDHVGILRGLKPVGAPRLNGDPLPIQRLDRSSLSIWTIIP
jgi:hypothetical protein